MADSLLDIVDGDDIVIGQALRSEIHAKGLRHREVHVWFVTPLREIIFQLRAPKPPKRYTQMLDASVGGHVELGQTFEQAALQEIEEETGRSIKKDNLIFYKNVLIDEAFPEYGIINNVIRGVYVYRFPDDVNTLRIEEGTGAGFLSIPASELVDGTYVFDKDLIVIPYLLKNEMIDFYKEIASGRYDA